MKICAVHIILWPAKCFQKSLTAPLNSYCIFLKKTFSRIFQARKIFNARCFQKRFFIFLAVCAEEDQDNWIEYCCSDHLSILVKSCLNPSSNFLVLCVSFPWRRLESFLIFFVSVLVCTQLSNWNTYISMWFLYWQINYIFLLISALIALLLLPLFCRKYAMCFYKLHILQKF